MTKTTELTLPMMLDHVLKNQAEIMHALRFCQGLPVSVDVRLSNAVSDTHAFLGKRKGCTDV